MGVSIDGYAITEDFYYQPSLRVNEIKFGDGYEQSIQDGMNPEEDEWFVTYAPHEIGAATSLCNILRASKGAIDSILLWTPPNGSTQQSWKASGVKMIPKGGGLFEVSCTLKRANILG